MRKNKFFALALIGALTLSPLTSVNTNMPVYAEEAASQDNTADTGVLLTTITSVEDLLKKIDNDLPYSSQDIVNSYSNGNAYKLMVPEDGWLILKDNSSSDLLQSFSLYSNFDLTNLVEKSDSDQTIITYVEKGTYYYRASNNAASVTRATHSIYAGFIPCSDKISVKSIKLSKDKSTAVITFDTSLDYVTIRTVRGDIYYKDYNNNTVWHTENRLNCAEDLKYTVSSNGTYTTRIAPSGDTDMFCYMIKYQVSGINSSKPSAPTVKTYKRNTKVVKGTGKAYTKVFVTIGNKTYKSTVSSNGTYSVKTCKLKKGTKLKVYLKNSADTASKTKTVTVK